MDRRGKLLSRHVRWFEEQQVEQGLRGVDFILRSFHHLSFASIADAVRLREVAQPGTCTNLAAHCAQKPLQMSVDSTFDVDLLLFRVRGGAHHA
jgi:hypothetical protein